MPRWYARGYLRIFSFFFGGRSAINWTRVYLLRVYTYRHCGRARIPKCLPTVNKEFINIFLSEKFDAIPHPTHVPQAPSHHSTKILRYAIHAQFNYRGRERHTSGLICGQNSILGGLEARRARSLDLYELSWGLCVGALLWPFSVLIIKVSEKTAPMGVEARVVYSMWKYTKAP